MKKKKKGFTLIELLAIIVILAIIAVITVPIILNIIENSKRGAVIDSAYGYKDSINKYYVTELANNPEFALSDGLYTVQSDGSIKNGDNSTYTIPFTGTKPSGGSITLENNEITDACIIIDEYAVTYAEGKFTTNGKGNCTNSGGGLVGDQPQTYKKYEDGTEIYFDVDSGTGCTEEEYNDNKEKASENPLKSSCMKFFAFLDSENSETVNLILDHNTTATVAWNSSRSNAQGPSTNAGQLLNQLCEDTKNWETESMTASDNYNPNNSFTWTIDYTTGCSSDTENTAYKARLITAEEVAEITKNDRSTKNQVGSSPEANWGLGSSWFLLDKGTIECYNSDDCDTQNVTSKYWWLFDNTNNCTTYGCKTVDNSTKGYWTSSPNAGNSNSAWDVGSDGGLKNYIIVSTDSSYGVRPVITVSKSKLSS